MQKGIVIRIHGKKVLKIMIPKKIHYCWFSGDAFPKDIQICIDSQEDISSNYQCKFEYLLETHLH